MIDLTNIDPYKDWNMLGILHSVEKQMPTILATAEWKSLDVDYHPPHVQRVYADWLLDESVNVRICLHRFPDICRPQDALMHPHPWPSAMRIIEGEYHMEVATEHNNWKLGDPLPRVGAEVVLVKGSFYQMNDWRGWHRVIPHRETYTLMVMGPLYPESKRSKGCEKPDKALGPLDEKTMQLIVKKFQNFYNL